jgi:mannosyltransferase
VPSLLILLPVYLAIAWRWSSGLTMGFWIDECGAYWLSQHLPAVYRPPFDINSLSALYATLLSLFAWAEPPLLEYVARLPSVLAAIGCAAVLYRISERVNGAGTGWIAALVYAILPDTLEFATQARPYALAQFIFALSLLMLYTWTVRREGWLLVMHTACLVLLVYLHPFFGLSPVLIWCFLAWGHRGLLWRYSIAMAGAAIALLPLVYVITHLQSTVQSIAYLPNPGVRLFAMDLVQGEVGLAIAGAMVLAVLIGARPRVASLFPLWPVIVLAWPILLFVLARKTGSSFYTTRYLALSQVGFALLVAAVLRWWRPSQRQAMMAAAVLVCFWSFRNHPAPHGGQDLRTFAQWLEDDDGGGRSPWVTPSLFVERSRLDPAPPDELLASWAFTHVTTYPVANPAFPMPFRFDESGRAALEAQLDGPWRAERRIIAGPERSPPQWFLDVFLQRGYQLRRLGDMVEFRR